MKTFPVILSLCVVVCVSGYSQTPTTKWLQADGPYGAAVTLLSADTSLDIYAGTSGGAYRLSHETSVWERLDSIDTQVFALAAQGNIIIVCVSAHGVMSSIDGGKTWVSSKNMIGKAIWISHFGETYFCESTNVFSLYRSVDSGLSWTQIPKPSTSADEILSISENRTGDILIGTVSRVYGLDRISSKWSTSTQTFTNVTTLAVDSTGIVYAGTDKGLFQSTDDGITWKETAITNVAIKYVVVDRNSRVYVSSTEGLYYTDDHGTNWKGTGWSNGVITGLTVGQGGDVFAGTGEVKDGGVYKSTDRGATWNPLMDGLSSVDIRWIENIGNDVIATTLKHGLYRSTDYGKSWVAISDSFYTSLTGNPDGSLWGSLRKNLYHSTDFGKTWTLQQLPFVPTNSISDLLIEPDGSLYMADEYRIQKSTDNGQTWDQVTAFNLYGNRNNKISMVRDDSGVLFAGVTYPEAPEANHVIRSTDRGKSWQNLENSPVNVRGIGVNNRQHVVSYGVGGISRSTNNGETWSPINAGLPSGAYPYSITSDDNGNFYMSTDQGIAMLPMNGALWEKMSMSGLFGPSARAVLATRGGTLLAGMADNGIFIYGQSLLSVESLKKSLKWQKLNLR